MGTDELPPNSPGGRGVQERSTRGSLDEGPCDFETQYPIMLLRVFELMSASVATHGRENAVFLGMLWHPRVGKGRNGSKYQKEKYGSGMRGESFSSCRSRTQRATEGDRVGAIISWTTHG